MRRPSPGDQKCHQGPDSFRWESRLRFFPPSAAKPLSRLPKPTANLPSQPNTIGLPQSGSPCSRTGPQGCPSWVNASSRIRPIAGLPMTTWWLPKRPTEQTPTMWTPSSGTEEGSPIQAGTSKPSTCTRKVWRDSPTNPACIATEVIASSPSGCWTGPSKTSRMRQHSSRARKTSSNRMGIPMFATPR